ncbi:MAG: P-II family nitrogen regulator [Nitrososphaeraceae archaeon]
MAEEQSEGFQNFHLEKIEVIVEDSLVKAVMNDILNILREGSFASGKIFVSDIMEAYDIETKETGEAAL